MYIILLIMILFVSSFLLGASVQKAIMKNKTLDAESVVACFKDVDWAMHRFSVNGRPQTSSDGTELFYKAPPIKDAIKRLNDLLDKQS